MRRSAKGWLIGATVLVVLGLLMMIGALAAVGFDYSKLSTVKYTAVSDEVSGDFDTVAIDIQTAQVELMRSENDRCRLEYSQQEKVTFSAQVRENTLFISEEDKREWFDRVALSFDKPKLTVYLPKTAYTSLFVHMVTGDISVPGAFSFDSLSVVSTTSDVSCLASVKEELEIRLVTGDIKLQSLSAGKISLQTTTGDLLLDGVRVGGDVDIHTVTGDTTLKNTVAAGKLTVSCTTGDLTLKDSDAAQLFVSATTGDVTGTLLSPKTFAVRTFVGEVRVPENSEGGKCEITTHSGDIVLSVAQDAADKTE